MEISIRIVPRWWLRWYIAGVMLTCKATGKYPDKDQLSYWLLRGFKVKVA